MNNEDKLTKKLIRLTLINEILLLIVILLAVFIPIIAINKAVDHLCNTIEETLKIESIMPLKDGSMTKDNVLFNMIGREAEIKK